MNVVVPLENDPHQAVQALLPWYARNRLDDDEAALVREHLLHCADCRADLDAERPLQALLAATADAPDASASKAGTEAALARMRQRIKADAPPRGTPHWLRWAFGAQSAAIAAMLVMLLRPHGEAPAGYVGLSAPIAATHTDALIMFRPQASEQQIREALLRHGATIVGGPTESGAYRLNVSGGAPALAALRGEPIVSVAESLDPAARP